MAESLRVLFLTLYPKEAPSPRYRVYQMLPELERLGFECEVRSLLDSEQFHATRQKGRWVVKSAMLAAATLRRLRIALSAHRYDVVYLLKGALPYGPAMIEQVLARSGTPLVFDFDDAIHIRKPSLHFRAMDWMKSTKRVSRTLSMADHVVVPNSYLATYSRQFNSCVAIVPEAENTDRLTPRPPHSGEARTVGWVGSPSTAKYLSTITPALREVCRRFAGVVVRVIGGEYDAEGVRVESVPWSYSQECSLFHGLDIGLMPLPLEEWSRGKSGCKMRQYMASGVPGVATDIGYNRELVESGRTGFLVTSQDDWVEALSRLIENPELRNSIATTAREDVVDRFRISKVARQLAGVLRDVASRDRREVNQPGRIASDAD